MRSLRDAVWLAVLSKSIEFGLLVLGLVFGDASRAFGIESGLSKLSIYGPLVILAAPVLSSWYVRCRSGRFPSMRSIIIATLLGGALIWLQLSFTGQNEAVKLNSLLVYCLSLSFAYATARVVSLGCARIVGSSTKVSAK